MALQKWPQLMELPSLMKSFGGSSYDEGMYHMGNSGRYAASSFSWDNRHFIAGGMLNEGNDHKPTNDVREYKGLGFSSRKLVWKRKRGMKQKA